MVFTINEIKAFTFSTINSFFSKFDRKDFYIEEDILKLYSIENKYYYSRGKVHARNNKIVSKEIKKICSMINRTFNMDIYSVDIVKTNNKFFVIDLNPAVGFYLSDKGRKDFINMVNDIIEKQKWKNHLDDKGLLPNNLGVILLK